ncbi:MAG: LysR family transcriptional regulator [Sedimenticolaceae bacterium]
MDLSALQAFVAVAQNASFSHAAEQLFVSQSAISKRIAQLETDIKAQLFDRIGRKVALTEAGHALLPRAQRLLNDAKELQRVVADLQGDIAGKLTMGTSHHIGLHRLPDPLRQFTQLHPNVELDIQFMDSEEACHAVEVGELELAIVTLPPTPRERLSLTTIWHDPLVFVAAKDHALCHQKSSLADLAEHSAVLPSTHTYTRGILESLLRNEGLALNVAMETNYLETLRMLVSTGLGWSLLPKTLIADDIQEIKIPKVQLQRELGVVTHEKRSLSNAAQAMIRLCGESA